MPEQMEVEIALRDSISAGLRQVGREIDNITKRMKEGGDGGTDAFNKFGKGARDAKDAADRAKEAASGLSGFLVGMSRTLIGVTGVAAGFYAVSSALENIAQKRVALQNLGTDLGFTTEKISLMQRALSKIGLEAGDQNKLITNFGQGLREVFKLQERSPILLELRSMSEHNFAGQLKEMVNAGADLDVTMKAVAGEWQRLIDIGKPQAAKAFADIFQIPESVMKNIMEATKGLKAGYQIDYEISKEYLQNTLALERQVNDITAFLEEKVQQTYNAAFRMLKVFDWKSLMPYILPPEPEKKGDTGPKAPKQMGTFGLQDSGALPAGAGIASYVERGMREEDKKTNRLLGEIADTLKIFESTTRTSGGGYTSRGGLGSGLDLGGAARGSGGGGGVTSLGGGAGGGAPSLSAPMGRPQAFQGRPSLGQFSRPPGAQTGGGLSQSQHAPIQTQVPITNNSLSGVRANFAEELKDPAVRDRLIAYTQAEVGGEGPQAVQAFMETTLNRAASRGKSIRETLSGSYFPKITHQRAAAGATNAMREKFGSTIDTVMGGSNISGFATGNASGTVGFAGGPQTSKFGRERFGIEGPDRSWVKRQQASMDAAGGTGGGGEAPPSDVLDQARRVALESGPGGVQAFMRQQGYPKNGAWCGQFAASVITSTGGTPPKNPQVASNWRNWGSPTSDPQPGDIAVRKGAQTGSTGSHVTFVESVDAKSGTFKGFGGNQGGRARSSQFPIGGSRGFDFRRADRDTIDASLQRKVTNAQTSKGDVKAEVDFSNMPAAQKKSGDELGKFKLLKLSPAPQGAKDNEGLMTPGDLAHTPYVP